VPAVPSGDFEQPSQSQLFDDLARSRDSLVSAVAGTFRSLVCLAPRDIPPLHQPGTCSSRTREVPTAGRRRQSGLPEWMDDSTAQERDTNDPAIGTDSKSQAVDLGWLMENWDTPGLRFVNSPWPVRCAWIFVVAALAASLTLLLTGFPLLPGTLVLMFATAVAVSATWTCYADDPALEELGRLERRVGAARREAEDAGREVERRESDLKGLLVAIDAREASLRAVIAEAQANEQYGLVLRAQTLAGEKARLKRERGQAKRDMEDSLQQARERSARVVADIDRRIAGQRGIEASMLSAALTQKQDDHVRAVLAAARLLDAVIHGVGEVLKARLWQHGFKTAADVSHKVSRVYGIGLEKGRAIISWRDCVKARADRSKPTALTSAEVSAIRQKVESERLALLDQREKSQRNLHDHEKSAQTAYSHKINRLDQEERALERESALKEDQIRCRAKTAIREANEKLHVVCNERMSPRVHQARRDCAEARKAQATANWNKARLEHQTEVGRARLGWSTYVKRILGTL